MDRRRFLALSGLVATSAALIDTAPRVGAATSGQGGGIRVLFEGDSLTYGYCGTTGGGIGSLQQLAVDLTNAGMPAAVGLSVPPEAGKGDIDERWGPGTGWSQSKVSGQSWGGDGAAYRNSFSNSLLTYTPGTLCDTFDVYWIGETNGGELDISIDGGQPVPVSTKTSSPMIGRTTIQASSKSSSHVLAMGGKGNRIVIGVEPYVSADTSTVLLANAGVDGAQSEWWVRNNLPGEGPMDCVAAYGADIVVISLGGDDLAGGIAMTDWHTDMQALVTAAQTDGAAVILSNIEPVDPSLGNLQGSYDTQMQPWNADLASWASTWQPGPIPVVDLYTYFNDAGTFDQLKAKGYYYTDGVHLTPAGYAFRAGAFVAAVQTAVSALP